MEYNKSDWSVKHIVEKIVKKRFNFDFGIQRSEGVWNKEQQSLFIDSLIRGYIIPPIYILKDGSMDGGYEKASILDGKQRLTTIVNYINDEFKLSKALENIIINGKEYILANRKYSQLDEEIKERLLEKELMICWLKDYTDEQIEEQFYRFNNGSTFTKQQKAVCVLGDELATKVKQVSENGFFDRCKISDNQRVRGICDEMVLKSLMLVMDWDFKSFSSGEVERFADYLNGLEDKHEVKTQLDNINTYLEKLDSILMIDEEIDAFLKPINIPLLVYLIKEKIETMALTDDEFDVMLSDFISEVVSINPKEIDLTREDFNIYEQYVNACGAGASHKDKVNARKDILIDILYEAIDRKEAENNSELEEEPEPTSMREYFNMNK
jgi:hypothetical protein